MRTKISALKLVQSIEIHCNLLPPTQMEEEACRYTINLGRKAHAEIRLIIKKETPEKVKTERKNHLIYLVKFKQILHTLDNFACFACGASTEAKSHFLCF